MSELRKVTLKGMAREYLRIGIKVLPGVFKSKLPLLKGWNTKEIDEGQVDKYFVGKKNILLRNGSVSGNLIDIDLDSDEARRIATRHLPNTPFVTGRRSSPSSHYYYRGTEQLKRVKYEVPGHE